MINFKDLHQVEGKNISLLLISISERDQDYAVITGTALWNDNVLRVDFGQNEPLFTVPKYALDRLRPVNDEVRDIIRNAEFYLPLFITDLPSDADPASWIYTGLQWLAN
jgi:hypothetical protein